MMIKKSQLNKLIKEIVKETFQIINESENGEWWIYPGGMTQYADGNVGDSNHEGYVIQDVSREIYGHFIGNPPDEMGYLSEHEEELYTALQQEGRLSEEDIEEWREGNGPTEVLENKLLEDKVYKDREQAGYAVMIAWGSSSRDARDYAMKYLGWKRMTTSGGYTEIQTWFLRQSDLDDIRRGIYHAWGGMGDVDEEDSEHTVSIEVRSNNKQFSNIPLEVISKASVRDIITYKRELAWMRERKQKTAPIVDPVNFTSIG